MFSPKSMSNLGRLTERNLWSAFLPKEYSTTLLVMVDRVKGEWRAPAPSPGWADFTIMMECTPDSGHCHSGFPEVDPLLRCCVHRECIESPTQAHPLPVVFTIWPRTQSQIMIILEAFCVDYPSLHVGLHYSPLHPSTVFFVEIECEGTRVFCIPWQFSWWWAINCAGIFFTIYGD